MKKFVICKKDADMYRLEGHGTPWGAAGKEQGRLLTFNSSEDAWRAAARICMRDGSRTSIDDVEVVAVETRTKIVKVLK